MLYDPKWEQKKTADPLSLAGLIAWLETQPSEGTYCYASNGKCLLALYFTARGFRRVNMGPTKFYHGRIWEYEAPLPHNFNAIAMGKPRTMGAALERARAAQP